MSVFSTSHAGRNRKFFLHKKTHITKIHISLSPTTAHNNTQVHYQNAKSPRYIPMHTSPV